MCGGCYGERTFAVGGGGVFLTNRVFLPACPEPPCTYSLPPADVKPWLCLAVGGCPLVAESSVQVLAPMLNE